MSERVKGQKAVTSEVPPSQAAPQIKLYRGKPEATPPVVESGQCASCGKCPRCGR